MSKLKAFEVTGKALFGRTCTEKVYLKSEADKVIAEKDKVIAELKSDIADLRDDKKSTDAILDERNAEIAELKADKTFVFGEECEAYKKSEVDKVIAELEESHKKEVGQLLIEIVERNGKHKTEVKELLCLIRDKENNFNRAFDSEEKELRHHKYKRSLDNAWWCKKLIHVYALSAYTHRGWKIARYYDEKAELYRKWHKHWIKIAEKFKEGV